MPAASRRLVLHLLLLAIAAFSFGFAMVPLYDVLCEATGLNGRSSSLGAGGAAAAVPIQPDRTRTVRVEFTGTVMPGLDWEMRPLTASLDTHPGELQQVMYRVRNRSSRPIVGQAIPSISPGAAARHFRKLDCFCFRRQTLAPGESRDMPLAFMLASTLDSEVKQITLSYAFYDIGPAP